MPQTPPARPDSLRIPALHLPPHRRPYPPHHPRRTAEELSGHAGPRLPGWIAAVAGSDRGRGPRAAEEVPGDGGGAGEGAWQSVDRGLGSFV